MVGFIILEGHFRNCSDYIVKYDVFLLSLRKN